MGFVLFRILERCFLFSFHKSCPSSFFTSGFGFSKTLFLAFRGMQKIHFCGYERPSAGWLAFVVYCCFHLHGTGFFLCGKPVR